MCAALGVAHDEVAFSESTKTNHTIVFVTIYTLQHKTAVSISTLLKQPSFVSFLNQNLIDQHIILPGMTVQVSPPHVFTQASLAALQNATAKKTVYKPQIQSQGSKAVVLGGVGTFLVLMMCLSCIGGGSGPPPPVAGSPYRQEPYQQSAQYAAVKGRYAAVHPGGGGGGGSPYGGYSGGGSPRGGQRDLWS